MQVQFGGPLSAREMKRNAARAALEFVDPKALLGVGSGTTVWTFIELLAESQVNVSAAVAASNESARRLAEIGVEVVDLGDLHPAIYIDGADEIDMEGCALKGKGAAHTREKRIATASEDWVCIVDANKIVRELGDEMAVPIEVAADSVAAVTAAVTALGGEVRLREGVLTDAGNPVLDATGLDLLRDPGATEDALDAIPGVLGNGIFARRTADVILVGLASGGVSRIIPYRDGEAG